MVRGPTRLCVASQGAFRFRFHSQFLRLIRLGSAFLLHRVFKNLVCRSTACGLDLISLPPGLPWDGSPSLVSGYPSELGVPAPLQRHAHAEPAHLDEKPTASVLVFRTTDLLLDYELRARLEIPLRLPARSPSPF